MSRIAYRVDQVPAKGMGAFMPVAARTGSAATAGIEKRYLQQWAPTPDPELAGQANLPSSPQVAGSYADPPAGAPGAFARQHNALHGMSYWTTPQGMGPMNDPSMRIYSDNPLPVPAQNIVRTAAPAFTNPPFGTIISTPWPRPYITWPTWGTSRQA